MVAGFIDYRRSRFSDARIEHLLEEFLLVLDQVLDSPDRELGAWPPVELQPSPPADLSGKLESESRPKANASAASDLPRSELEPPGRDLGRGLSIRPIERTANFFELGGHSLLAARVFSRMEELLGRDLPLALLLKAPTIAELSRLLNQKGWAPSWSSLVPINPEGSRPPLPGPRRRRQYPLLPQALPAPGIGSTRLGAPVSRIEGGSGAPIPDRRNRGNLPRSHQVPMAGRPVPAGRPLFRGLGGA